MYNSNIQNQNRLALVGVGVKTLILTLLPRRLLSDTGGRGRTGRGPVWRGQRPARPGSRDSAERMPGEAGAGPRGAGWHRMAQMLRIAQRGARGWIAEEEGSWMEDRDDSTAPRRSGQALSRSGLPPPWLELRLVGVLESSPWVPEGPSAGTKVGGLTGLDLGT